MTDGHTDQDLNVSDLLENEDDELASYGVFVQEGPEDIADKQDNSSITSDELNEEEEQLLGSLETTDLLLESDLEIFDLDSFEDDTNLTFEEDEQEIQSGLEDEIAGPEINTSEEKEEILPAPPLAMDSEQTDSEQNDADMSLEDYDFEAADAPVDIDLSMEDDSGSLDINMEDDPGSLDINMEDDSGSLDISMEDDPGNLDINMDDDSGSLDINMDDGLEEPALNIEEPALNTEDDPEELDLSLSRFEPGQSEDDSIPDEQQQDPATVEWSADTSFEYQSDEDILKEFSLDDIEDEIEHGQEAIEPLSDLSEDPSINPLKELSGLETPDTVEEDTDFSMDIDDNMVSMDDQPDSDYEEGLSTFDTQTVDSVGAEALQSIEQELDSIKTELTELKLELSRLRSMETSETEDDMVALTRDEMDNILTTSDSVDARAQSENTNIFDDMEISISDTSEDISSIDINKELSDIPDLIDDDNNQTESEIIPDEITLADSDVELTIEQSDQEVNTLSGSPTPELKNEVREVLKYMDSLLENLPEKKIEEFARSEHFETYQKLFTELGL